MGTKKSNKLVIMFLVTKKPIPKKFLSYMNLKNGKNFFFSFKVSLNETISNHYFRKGEDSLILEQAAGVLRKKYC